MPELLIKRLTEQELKDIARQAWDDTLKEHPIEDTKGRPYPYWLDTFSSVMYEAIVGPQEDILTCGHYAVNESVLGHCRACDYEIQETQ